MDCRTLTEDKLLGMAADSLRPFHPGIHAALSGQNVCFAQLQVLLQAPRSCSCSQTHCLAQLWMSSQTGRCSVGAFSLTLHGFVPRSFVSALVLNKPWAVERSWLRRHFFKADSSTPDIDSLSICSDLSEYCIQG